MPIDATPCAQVVVALAAKFTAQLAVLPFPGLVTVTPAKAGRAARMRTKIKACFFIKSLLPEGTIRKSTIGRAEIKGSHRNRRETLSFSEPPTNPEQACPSADI